MDISIFDILFYPFWVLYTYSTGVIVTFETGTRGQNDSRRPSAHRRITFHLLYAQ